MIDWHALIAVALVVALGVMSPGPNFLAVAQRALAFGRNEALVTAAGVVSVSGVWAASALFGLGIVFRLFPWIHVALRLAGAAYVIWFGIKLWRNARKPIPVPDTGEDGTRSGYGRAFRAGLATNLSNAKAIAFYSSVFSAAAPSAGEIATLWLAIAIVMGIAMLWYGFVAVALSSGPAAATYRRFKTGIERVCGTLMIAFGVELAVAR